MGMGDSSGSQEKIEVDLNDGPKFRRKTPAVDRWFLLSTIIPLFERE
jgi:hypothetical protein